MPKVKQTKTGATRGRTGMDIKVQPTHEFFTEDEIREHHASLVIQAASDAHSHIVELKHAIDTYEKSKHTNELRDKLAGAEYNLRLAIHEAKGAGIDVDKLGLKALKQVRTARETYGFSLSESSGQPKNHVQKLVERSISQQHLRGFAPAGPGDIQHHIIAEFVDDRPQKNQKFMKGHKRKAKWRKKQRKQRFDQEYEERCEHERENMEMEYYQTAYHFYQPQWKQKKYETYKKPTKFSIPLDDATLTPYRKADTNRGERTKQRNRKMKAGRHKEVLWNYGGRLPEPELDMETPQFKASLTSIGESMRMMDELMATDANIARAINDIDRSGQLGGKPGKMSMSGKHSAHDDTMRHLHQTYQEYREEHTNWAKSNVNKALWQKELPDIRKDFVTIKKWQKQRRQHKRAMKNDLDTLGTFSIAAHEAETTATGMPASQEKFASTDFFINASGLYEAQDLKGNWHKATVTASLGKGAHAVAIKMKHGVTMTNRKVAKGQLRVAPTFDQPDLYEAHDSSGRYWDVTVKRREGSQLQVDVLTDGKIVKRGLFLPENNINVKVLTGLTGLYEARDNIGNWYRANVTGRTSSDKPGGWYEIDVVTKNTLLRGVKAKRNNIRLRPGAQFFGTKSGGLRGKSNLLRNEMSLYKNIPHALTPKSFKMGSDLSPRRKNTVERAHADTYNTGMTWNSREITEETGTWATSPHGRKRSQHQIGPNKKRFHQTMEMFPALHAYSNHASVAVKRFVRLHNETDSLLQLFATRHSFKSQATAPPPSKAVERAVSTHNPIDHLYKVKLGEGTAVKNAVASAAVENFAEHRVAPTAKLDFLNTLHTQKTHAHAPDPSENLRKFTRRATAPCGNIQRFAMLHVQRQHAHCPPAAKDVEQFAESHVFHQARNNPFRQAAAEQFASNHTTKNANLNLFTQLHAMRQHATAPEASKTVMDFVEQHNDPHGLLDHITMMHFFQVHSTAPPASEAVRSFAQSHAQQRTKALLRMHTMGHTAKRSTSSKKAAPKPTTKSVQQFRRHSAPGAPPVNTPASPRLQATLRRQSVGAVAPIDIRQFDGAGKAVSNGTGAPPKLTSSSHKGKPNPRMAAPAPTHQVKAPAPTHQVKGKTRSGSPWPGQHNRAPAPPANSRRSSPAESIQSKASSMAAPGQTRARRVLNSNSNQSIKNSYGAIR